MMYTVRAKSGRVMGNYETEEEAEARVAQLNSMGQRAQGSPRGRWPSTPLSVARADVAAGRFSTLRVQQENGGYWYVGHLVDRPLYRDRPEGVQALVFETLAGPFASRGYAEKIIERARKRADQETLPARSPGRRTSPMSARSPTPDHEIHAAVDAAKRARKSAETKAQRTFEAAKNRALTFFGSTDVERAARTNAIRRAQVELEQQLDAARAKYNATLETIRARAGQWADLVPAAR